MELNFAFGFKLRKAAALVLIFLFFLPFQLFAQEEDEDLPSAWDYVDDLYTRGDQTFMISAGVVFPGPFFSSGQLIQSKLEPPVGGTGTLALNYYLNSFLSLGGELGGMFMPTIGENTLFVIYLGARIGLQFNIGRFEFPFSAAVGMSWQTHLQNRYFGLYIKGGTAAYFRATHQWSFGLNANWFWLPEWTSDRSKNVDGNIIDLTLSARYHF